MRLLSILESVDYTGIPNEYVEKLQDFKQHFQEWAVLQLRSGENINNVIDSIKIFRDKIRDNRFSAILARHNQNYRNIMNFDSRIIHNALIEYQKLTATKPSNRKLQELRRNWDVQEPPYSTILVDSDETGPTFKIIRVSKVDDTGKAAKIAEDMAYNSAWCVVNTEMANHYLNDDDLYYILLDGEKYLCSPANEEFMDIENNEFYPRGYFDILGEYIPNIGIICKDPKDIYFKKSALILPYTALRYLEGLMKWISASSIYATPKDRLALLQSGNFKILYNAPISFKDPINLDDLENVIAQSPPHIIYYVKEIKQQRWLEAEKTIMNSNINDIQSEYMRTIRNYQIQKYVPSSERFYEYESRLIRELSDYIRKIIVYIATFENSYKDNVLLLWNKSPDILSSYQFTRKIVDVSPLFDVVMYASMYKNGFPSGSWPEVDDLILKLFNALADVFIRYDRFQWNNNYQPSDNIKAGVNLQFLQSLIKNINSYDKLENCWRPKTGPLDQKIFKDGRINLFHNFWSSSNYHANIFSSYDKRFIPSYDKESIMNHLSDTGIFVCVVSYLLDMPIILYLIERYIKEFKAIGKERPDPSNSVYNTGSLRYSNIYYKKGEPRKWVPTRWPELLKLINNYSNEHISAWADEVGLTHAKYGITESVDASKKLYHKLVELKEKFVEAAQKVYDEWEQDVDGYDEEYGGGGICQNIAEAISNIVGEHIPHVDHGTISANSGEQHVWCIVTDGVEAYEIDIPFHEYESGGGYSWRKLPNVEFIVDNIVITPMRPDDAKNALESQY